MYETAKTLFVLSILLSAQALAFDVGGLSYAGIFGTTDVRVKGCAADSCTSSDIVIPDTVVDSGITYSVTAIESFAFEYNALTSVIIPDSVETIKGFAFQNNDLTSAAFEGDFGGFQLGMFGNNPTLTTITYCDGTAGWPQGFNNGSTIIVTEPVDCSTAPDAPQITGIEPGNGQVSISVSVADDGGSPITDYSAVCASGTGYHLGTSPTSPITVFGLTNGQAYVCATTATNNFGTSPASELSAPVTPVAPAPGC